MWRKLLTFFTIFVLVTISLLAAPVKAACDQPFRGHFVTYSADGGATYKPVTAAAYTYMQTITVCTVTATIALGALQSPIFSADYRTLVVYAAPDASAYYVHRWYQVYPISREQWNMIVALLRKNRP